MDYIRSSNWRKHSSRLASVCQASAGPCHVSVRLVCRLTFLTTPPSEAFTPHTHTEWDAYLCQEQLTQKQITLSLTHKGQVNQLNAGCTTTHPPGPFLKNTCSVALLRQFVLIVSLSHHKCIFRVNPQRFLSLLKPCCFLLCVWTTAFILILSAPFIRCK